ncbi:hypothetical protein QL285_046250 [Trifolium repens]|nr:hypothetical protein QL285_046250 [Trifolium repens]
MRHWVCHGYCGGRQHELRVDGVADLHSSPGERILAVAIGNSTSPVTDNLVAVVEFGSSASFVFQANRVIGARTRWELMIGAALGSSD